MRGDGDSGRVVVTVEDAGEGVPTEREGELSSHSSPPSLTAQASGCGVCAPSRSSRAAVYGTHGGTSAVLRADAADPGVSAKVVLIVEDEAAIREGLAAAVRRLGLHPVLAAGVREARAALVEHVPACVLLDMRLDDGDGLELLREVKRGPRRAVPVIIATAYGDGERTIAAMRDGAFDYLTKPFDLPVLLCHGGARAKAAGRHAGGAGGRAPGDDEMGGRSAAMHGLRKLVGRAAATDDTVLVVGERDRQGAGGEGRASVLRASAGGVAVLRATRASRRRWRRRWAQKRGVLIIETSTRSARTCSPACAAHWSAARRCAAGTGASVSIAPTARSSTSSISAWR